MTQAGQAHEGTSPLKHRPPIKLGVLLAIASEGMLFAGLISAFLVIRAGAVDWPPLGQPRLPVESTAFNTLLLLISGFTTWLGIKKILRKQYGQGLLGVSAILGLAFLWLQGREWLALMNQGVGIESNPFGAFFYMIVGLHGLHVMVAVMICLWVYLQSLRGHYTNKNHDGLIAFSYFWYFVVALWPPLYFLVYLW